MLHQKDNNMIIWGITRGEKDARWVGRKVGMVVLLVVGAW